MHRSPWNRLDVNCLSLIRRILAPLPSTRLSIEKIKSHRWFSKHIGSDIVDSPVQSEFNSTAKRMRSDLDTNGQRTFCDDDRACISQPEPFALRAPMNVCDVEPHLFSFSQPTHLDDLLVSSQFVSTQSTQTSQSTVQKLVRRMTRFFVKYAAEEAVEKLCMILDKLGYSWRCHTPAIVSRHNILVEKLYV
uniref:Serine/threonine-protein kinase Chk1 n=1 Tax=Cacopsylla melanoneura TaxID=428564 RepID=A0A8D9A1G7_9HEMI